VEHWKQFSSPIYPAELMMEKYHIVRDKGTANFYVNLNNL